MSKLHPIKIQTFSAPQNDCLNLSFVKDMKIENSWQQNGYKSEATNIHKMDFVSCKFWATGSGFNGNRLNQNLFQFVDK